MFWTLILVPCGLTVLAFGFVVIWGAPFLPTLRPQIKTALDLVDLKPGQIMLELGSGDGRVLAAAAERGIDAIGYELNPLLVIYSWLRTRKYGRKVRIIWGSYWSREWPQANGIFVFLLDKYMKKLDKKIVQNYPGQKVKLVSFAFKIPDKRPTQEQDGLYLYEY